MDAEGGLGTKDKQQRGMQRRNDQADLTSAGGSSDAGRREASAGTTNSNSDAPKRSENKPNTSGRAKRERSGLQESPMRFKREGVVEPQTVIVADDDDAESAGAHLSIPPQLHYYNVSIDLQRLEIASSVRSAVPFFLTARYTYPFFGSSAPILTYPPLEMRRGQTGILPRAYCAFDFAANSRQLDQAFTSLPLIVELWNRDPSGRIRDELFGVLQIPLTRLLRADRRAVELPDGTVVYRRAFGDALNVFAPEKANEVVGKLFIECTLDDRGTTNVLHIVSPKKDANVSGTVPPANDTFVMQERPADRQQPDIRKTLEYRTALELETWKAEQQAAFENELRAKEFEFLRRLGAEWKRRETERELETRRKLERCNELETRLKTELADLERRHRALLRDEAQLQERRAQFETESRLREATVRDELERARSSCEYQVELERAKARALDEQIGKLKAAVGEQERKYAALEEDFARYKRDQNDKPEFRLQAEINMLTLEKGELEKKLDAALRSKSHYKANWSRALKEIGLLRENARDTERASLRKQQTELEHMRMRYLANEEQELLNNEKQQLRALKQELVALQKARETTSAPSATLDGATSNFDAQERFSRLAEERETLLRTGVYTADDNVIRELDAEMQKLAHLRV